MNAILFRKLEVDGVNYYQLFSQKDNFEPDDTFTDFLHRGEKEYFYIDADSDIYIPDAAILNLYYDTNEGFTNLLDSNIFMKVFNAFVEKYNIVIKEIKPIEEVLNKVKEKIMFQDDTIEELIRRIYLNQSFVISELPIELKNSQRNNIIFHGMSGSGKKTIVECLEKELNIPYVDVTLTASIKDTLETIIETLLERADSPEEASFGIVFIRDNYTELQEAFGDSVFNLIKFLTSQRIIQYKDALIDFRTITFVMLYDDDNNDLEIDEVKHITDCMYEISTAILTDEEKYQVLYSENGSIYHYQKFFNRLGKKFIFDDKCLMQMIRRVSLINPSMDAVNKMINAIVNYATCYGITDIIINKDFMESFNQIFDSVLGNQEDKEIEDDEVIDRFIFEKKVDSVVNKVTKYVIGQDDQVRSLVSQLMDNLNLVNNEELYSPKSYMHNILIRGESGCGKTFLVETVSKALDVPIHIVDATKYTEEGYVGGNIEDMFKKLYIASGYNLEKAQKGILVIDEIDKKANDEYGSHGPSRGAVLDGLLKPTEGSTVTITIGSKPYEQEILFDTSKVTIVCLGAFEGIEEIRDQRIGKRKAGFGNQDVKDIDMEITNDDYISYGMTKQFMNRVSNVIELNANSKELFMDIMKKSELSALKAAKVIIENRGIDIEYTESFCEELAKVAIKRKQGVRGIRNALEKVLTKINLQNIRASQVEKIILNDEVIHNPEKVILIERGKQKKLQIK